MGDDLNVMGRLRSAFRSAACAAFGESASAEIVPRGYWGFGFRTSNGRDERSFALGLGPYALTVTAPKPSAVRGAGSDPEARCWAAEVHNFGDEIGVAWTLGATYRRTCSDRNGWDHGNVNLSERVLGRIETTTVSLWEGAVSVPLPEGTYIGTGCVEETRHQRPYSPFVWLRSYRETVTVPQGIAVARPWTTLYSVGIEGRAVQPEPGAPGAVSAFVDDVMRKRRGDASWRPKPKRRRVLPIEPIPFNNGRKDHPRALVWEVRDLLTGKWRPMGAYVEGWEFGDGWEIDEPGCPGCGVRYGEPCRPPHPLDETSVCPNRGTRRENTLCGPEAGTEAVQ